MPRLGSEYLTSNAHTAFPFKEDAKGLARGNEPLTHGLNATLPPDFLIDAVIYTPDENEQVFLESISNQSGTYLFTFVNQSDALVAELTYVIGSQDCIGVQEGQTTVRLLKGPSFDSHLVTIPAVDTYVDSAPSLPFEDAVVEPHPPRVESFQLMQTPTEPVPTSPDPFTGHVRFLAGYNMVVDPQADDALDTTAIVLKARPGAGLGRVPCEEQPEPVRRRLMMGMIPDAQGSIYIEPSDDCYAVNPLEGNILQVAGDCYACCSCDDYLNVVKAVKALILRAATLKTDLLEQHTDKYSPSLIDYHDRHFPAVRKMEADVKCIAGVGDGARHHGHVSITLTNVSARRIKGITVDGLFESETGQRMACIGSATYSMDLDGAKVVGDVGCWQGAFLNTPTVKHELEEGVGAQMVARMRCKEPGQRPKWMRSLRVDYITYDPDNPAEPEEAHVLTMERVPFEGGAPVV